ncbi:MAG TPA: IMP dehydrogenase [Candidatus Saccharimonadales bacterium]|nr:IMP dehydrogenase [Candidatus Saccharimonadales bacterium]
MEMQLPLGLTFDDILLLPGYSDFSRADIDLSTQVTKTLRIKIPLVSAPMDTVTEASLAIKLAELGGLGIIHRNLSVADQADQVAQVKQNGLIVGAAVGGSEGFQDRVAALVKAGGDVLVVDTAHGFAIQILETIKHIKQTYPHIQVISGNIATFDGAIASIEAGADALRVGMGPGAICTTRIISGMGVPQVLAIQETVRAAKGKGVPVIADGGIKYSGDMVKALALGASSVMMGSFFAATEEAPGKVLELERSQVPRRFQSVFDKKKNLPAPSVQEDMSLATSPNLERINDVEVYKFKEYRGMGSIGAMEKGAEIKSEDEYHGKNYKDRVLVAEGVEGLVPVKGSVQQLVDQAVGGIKSGLYYIGAKTISELQEKAKFIQITQASLAESHPHDVLVTNPGENY